MGFKCGIIGLPNVGKSTLFNALTNSGISAENYPFCTIDPNIGTIPVSDPRLSQLAAIVNPDRVVPTQMEFVDIAGLVQGASDGEGLGNQFLSHIRGTKAIAQVVRCFEDDQIIHVNGKPAPLTDIEIINTELCLADQQTIETTIQKTTKKRDTKAVDIPLPLLKGMLAHLDQGCALRTMGLSNEQQLLISSLQLLTMKPMLYIANIKEGTTDSDQYLTKLRCKTEQEGAQLIPICAALEAEIAQLDKQERDAFLAALDRPESGLSRIIQAGYNLLGLQTFFTAGPKEVRAWTVKKGAIALDAAAAIHTDLKRGFIRAEVIAFADYLHYQGEQQAKNAGKWRLEGKEYAVNDGDIMLFRFKV